MPIPSRNRISVFFLLAACAEPNAPAQTSRSLGLIQVPTSSASAINLPGPLHAGIPTTVTVNTFGSSTCLAPDGMDVVYSDQGISLTPWDFVLSAAVCTDDLVAHPHHAIITVARPGTITLTAHGFVLDANNRRVRGSVSVDVAVQ